MHDPASGNRRSAWSGIRPEQGRGPGGEAPTSDSTNSATRLRFAGFELDLAGPELRRDGVVVALRPKSLALISHLARHPGQLVKKEDLVDAVWEGSAVSDATLARTLFDAREALGDDSREPRFLETVHRLGFRFLAEVESGPAPAAAAALPPRTTLIGREAERSRLAELRKAAEDGRRQIVFLAGEAGIGKTSILEDFVAAASQGAALVGRGQCIEHYGSAEAYLPLLDALGELCRGAGAVPVLAVLRRVAPTWLAQFPWLIREEDRAALERELRGVSSDRMLRELAEALETLAQERLVVLALEDLHWSDSATADLLAFLARRPAPAKLLVVATYRPVDAILSDNPIRAVHHELLRQNRVQSIAVDALPPEDVLRLCRRRFDDAPFCEGLAGVVHRRSEGNPLFVVSMLEDLVVQGRIARVPQGWELRAGLGEIEGSVPEDLRHMVRAQVDRLEQAERAAVEAASVVGVSFSAAAAAAALQRELVEVEELCEGLARSGVFLDRAGSQEWPDGTSASAYSFRHALYRDALYEGIPAARRRQLHERIGEALESGHAAAVAPVAGVLAMHFEEAGDHAKAARYYRQAAEVAARRGAPRETLALVARAREHLEELDYGFERTLEALMLEIAAGPALAAISGYAAPEVEEIFGRAREHCRALGDGPQLFPILWGLWAFWAVRGRINDALELAKQCMELADASGDRDLLLEAHHALWVTHFFRGEIGEADRHLDAGLELYDRGMHHAHVMLFGQDPGVVAKGYRALVRLAQGRVDESIEASEAAITLGRELGHPVSLIFGLHFAAWLHEQRGDAARCRELAMEVAEVATTNGMPFWLSHATWFASRAMATEDPASGAAGMAAGLEALRATGARMGVPAYVTTLARTCLAMGDAAESRRLVEEAWAITEETGEWLGRAEMLRLRGDLALHDGGGEARASAEAHFREAVELARRQQAPGLELRAALDLARLWRGSARETEVRPILSELLGRLPAGTAAPEIAEARALLA